MARYSSADDLALTEHTLTRFLLAGAVLIVVVFVGFNFLSRLFDGATDFHRELLTERFERSLSFTHQRWNERGRPSWMRLEYRLENNRSEKLKVYMNAAGWPINIGDPERRVSCENLWQYLAEDWSTEDKRERLTIQITEQEKGCRYQSKLSSGKTWELFYHLNTGGVSTRIE